jgi:hypothetical protein
MSKLTPPAMQNLDRRTRFFIEHPEYPNASKQLQTCRAWISARNTVSHQRPEWLRHLDNLRERVNQFSQEEKNKKVRIVKAPQDHGVQPKKRGFFERIFSRQKTTGGGK